MQLNNTLSTDINDIKTPICKIKKMRKKMDRVTLCFCVLLLLTDEKMPPTDIMWKKNLQLGSRLKWSYSVGRSVNLFLEINACSK